MSKAQTTPRTKEKRRAYTAILPKCFCGNVARSGYELCGPHQDEKDRQDNNREREETLLSALAKANTLEAVKDVMRDFMEGVFHG